MLLLLTMSDTEVDPDDVPIGCSPFGDAIRQDHWKPDEAVEACEAPGCNVPFSFFVRRHHCRRCGGIFCAKHSRKEMSLNVNAEPVISGGRRFRVCDECYALGYDAKPTARDPESEQSNHD